MTKPLTEALLTEIQSEGIECRDVYISYQEIMASMYSEVVGLCANHITKGLLMGAPDLIKKK